MTTPLAVDVTCEVWVKDTVGLSEAEIVAALSSGLTSTISETPIGGYVATDGDATGYVYVDQITAAIHKALPVGFVVRRSLTVPAADVAVGEDEAPVIGTIAPPTIHFVAREVA